MARPRKPETLTQVNVRLPKELIKTLQSESKKLKTTVSEIIRKKLGYDNEINYKIKDEGDE